MAEIIKYIRGKEYIFCAWRRKYVRLTPEEYVRQTFLHRLVEQYNYPASLIAVEVALPTVRDVAPKRADAILYTPQMNPGMLIEFKADTVALSQKTLDQITVYNRLLHVPYLVLNNGVETIVAHVSEQEIDFLPDLPQWKQFSL